MRASSLFLGEGRYLPPAFLLFVLFLEAQQRVVAQSFNMGDVANVESCTGAFHDSGGPSGDYANNEDLVITICPFGGEGAGPFTSVSFSVWDVAPGSGDQLVIHDGSSTADPILATGDGDNSLAGSEFTASNTGGCLTFRWTSDASGTAAGWVAAITTGPAPGSSAALTVCSNDPPLSMTAQLGGGPSPGGQWTDPDGVDHSATFVPASDVGGIYTYTVQGPAPCPDQSAELIITRVVAPNAGSNASLALCSDEASVLLFDELGGTPDPGGTWTGPGSIPHDGTFEPGVDVPGPYTYTVTGIPPCADASATVTVTVNTAPNAGSDGTVEVCSLDAAFDLIDELNGSPEAGGSWTGPDAQPVGGTFTPGSSQPGVYTYTVAGVPPCLSATATVTVEQVQAPDPGVSRSITVCSNNAPFALIDRLNGTPEPGGSWTAPGNVPFGDQFDPSVNTGGVYTYTVAGTPPCVDRSATLTITVRTAPEAGESAEIVLCSIDASVQLLGELSGSPDGNGVWTDPDGASSSGIFQPGTSQPGAYLYTVSGLSPCVPATATVTVEVNTAPVAGSNRTVAVCSDQPVFNLVDSLGGSPDPGGSWLAPGGVPHGPTFTPGQDQTGQYVYTVTGLAPCNDATATVTVNQSQAPNAGVDASVDLCSTDGATDLFELLGGTPQGTGFWLDPLGDPHSGTFVPGSDTDGNYVYTVPGAGPCADASATIAVTVNQAPDAGSNGSINVCSDGPEVGLFALLGGEPDAGGSWTDPLDGPHSGTYLPGSEIGGTYTYTVTGQTPCSDASSTVQVVRNMAPRAGTDGTITVCSTGGQFNLLSVLGGSPMSTGSWTDPGGQPFAGGVFVPGTSLPGTYLYVVTGTAPCLNDSSEVTVVVNTAPEPGENATVTVCSTAAPFSLLASLGGNPDVGGTWTAPNTEPHPAQFIPGVNAPGVYTYQVTGTAPCVNASATVLVQVDQQPSAGGNGSITVCSTQPMFNLFAQLAGDPSPGGTWTAPGGAAHPGMFIPGTSDPGDYTYTVEVPAGSPCVSAEAIVAVEVNPAPNAGEPASLTICDDVAQVDLFDVLDGEPDMNGGWTDDDGTGTLSGSMVSPFGLPPGDYDFTYAVPGIGLCEADSATVTLVVVDQLNAGQNTSVSICGSQVAFDLFGALTGGAQTGGTWNDDAGTGALDEGLFNASAVGAGTYPFTYTIEGSVSCADDSAILTVTVVAPPNAGLDGSISVCSNGSPFNLFAHLNGTPQGGGTWTGPLGQATSNTYDPEVNDPGVYAYRVAGVGPCPADTGRVTVTELQAPDAGLPNAVSVCNTSASFNLLDSLLGTPAATGTWTGPDLEPHGAQFAPASDLGGVYIYTVTGVPPCANSISTLTVDLNQARNPGNDGQTTVCSNSGQFLLLSVLGGAPELGGQWFDPEDEEHGGIFDPEVSMPGTYRYVLTGDVPCPDAQATATVFVNQEPDAGIGTSANFCSTGGTVNLFNQLGGTPDATGTWTDPNNLPHSGFFQPATGIPGTYTYTVAGVSPCTNASAQVNVSVSQAPNAGCNTSLVLCSSQSAVSLFTLLGCSPQQGGVWTYQGGPSDGIFFPNISPPGTYCYTVQGQSPCSSATACVTIAVNQQPFAGNDNNQTACLSGGAVPLFPLLGPGAQPGGSWTGPNGVHSGTFLPGIDPPGPYQYSLSAQAPCVPSTATISVSVNVPPQAGNNSVETICDDQSPFTLINLLGGQPDLNGTWTDPDGEPFNGIYEPGSSLPGPYTYTVPGLPPCPSASATVTIIENSAPQAGSNSVRTVCSNFAPFALIDELNGTPDPDGIWTGPGNTPSNGIFVPGSSQAGTYVYLVTGVAPCTNASANVIVFQNTAADAGINATQLICSNAPGQPLIDLLNGTPDANGNWEGPGGAHSGFFDPAVDVSGTYEYSVPAFPPCTTAQSVVQITLVPAPNAGEDGEITVCVDEANVVLFNGLEGTPQTGGTWVDADNTGQLGAGVFNTTGLLPGAYEFIYVLAGNTPCAADSATVVVVVADALDAGEDSTAQLCQGEVLDLFPLLGGSPQPGGTWTDMDGSGALIGTVFNSSAVAAGTSWVFRYVLAASAECLSDTAFVTIQVLEGPNAGCNGQLNLCSTSAAIDLSVGLNCDPDGGGSWTDPDGEPHGGTFTPGVDQPGPYTYTVPAVGNCPQASAEVTVNVVQAPNAGNDAQLVLCSTDEPVALFDLLGPEADPGGSWFRIPGNTPHPGIYDPVVDVSGNFQYVVSAQVPCQNATATVTVTENQAPFAGTNGSLTACSDDPTLAMFQFLGGAMGGGSWIDPNGEPHGPTFNPANGLGGVYTYVVTGIAPCANDSAELDITLWAAPNAGDDVTIDVCISQSAVDIFDALGDADEGGSWDDQNGTGALEGNILDATQVSTGTYTFLYSIPGQGTCSPASSVVTVNVVEGANAGADSTAAICGSATAFPLIDVLGGQPDPGGVWQDLLGTGAVTNGMLDATLLEVDQEVQYVYLIDDPICGAVSATVTLTIAAFPDPGEGSTVVLCSGDDEILLPEQLGGTPQNDGTWTGPDGSAHGLTFDPASDQPGEYTYTVTGTLPCTDAEAVVTVVVNDPPDAGANGEIIACDSLLAVDLFSGLEGTPQQGGSWTDVSGTGALFGGFFDASQVVAGIYNFDYEVDVEGCGSDAATVKVTVVDSVRISGLQRICNEMDRTYTVSFFIEGGDPDSYFVEGWPGILTDDDPPQYLSDPLFTSEPFLVTVSDQYGCGPGIVATVSPCAFDTDVFVPESFSPNGDGINDTFVIPGIEGYPLNEIVIFNRWGAEVFKTTGYDNRAKVWNGTSVNASLPGDLPTGTYFYVLELGNGAEAITGFVYLNR